MDVDRSRNRNCYAYGGFKHLAKNCKNRGNINQRIETEDNRNLNREGELIVFD